MAIVKPFKGLRPATREICEELACLPYDVMNTGEATRMAAGKPKSLLHVTRAEIDCPPGTDVHAETVYEKSVKNFKMFRDKGWLVQDEQPCFYVYAQTMEGRTQYGIVGCAACADYANGVIKKHELTRPDKEEDRMVLTRHVNANLEPVFFAYKAVPAIDAIVADVTSREPVYDFTAEDGFGHRFWVISCRETNRRLEELFATEVPCTYVADGHHRTAAAARIGEERRRANPLHDGSEEYNYFMAVHFPDTQLQIIDYNRVVNDLNGLTPGELVARLEECFHVQDAGRKAFRPTRLHEFGMYLEGHWFRLIARPEALDDSDPVNVLDVTILSRHVLSKIFDIQDLRRSTRVDFVGGIRGLGELQRRVDSKEARVAFALYPVSMEQLINIADTGNIMPPKTTWFEPKLRSGLVIHELD
ncbi:MAG: DUF1015 family protein [Odoribacteraceae bacterium]|jgi:uncharacterized protein (DUF1015 family)|nr:DUF1015 family protein [Odoribacteraceae bacterium]